MVLGQPLNTFKLEPLKKDGNGHMSIKFKIFNIVGIVIIIIGFMIYNVMIENDFRKSLILVSDGEQYCYGIDSFEKEENTLTLIGWFFELKSVRGIKREVVREDAEMMLALVPIEEASVGNEINDATFMKVVEAQVERSDVNDYFSCGNDYSKCGFTATISLQEINLSKKTYRLAVRQDSLHKAAVLVDIYLSDEGVEYTEPMLSPKLDTEGTDLDRIVKEGVRVVSRPDYDCYVYQYRDKLYWIADEEFAFCNNGLTYIEYQMNTTQIDNLPEERLQNDWLWSNIGDFFESHEITNQMDCGKYRVSVRDIPREYSVTNVCTGYYDNEWVWRTDFKPNYGMLIGKE